MLVAWSVARRFCCLPKSVHPERIRENLAAASLELTAEVRSSRSIHVTGEIAISLELKALGAGT